MVRYSSLRRVALLPNLAECCLLIRLLTLLRRRG
jgi:hypothetical protein